MGRPLTSGDRYIAYYWDVSSLIGQLFDAGRDHFDVLTGPLWEPVGRATVEVARPVAGERVFDACCGAGASAIPAAQAVGPDGRVDAVDLSGRLLALGRSRGAGLPQLSFYQADVTTWTGGPYDVVQCALGIFFLPDMTAATRAMARQLRPGGRFVATVWHQSAMAPLPELLAAALAPESPPRTSGSANRLNTAEALTGLFHSADLDEVHVITVPMAVPLTPELAWSVVLGSAMRARLSALDDDAVERTRQRFQQSLGTDTLDATILVGSGVAGVAACLRERQAPPSDRPRAAGPPAPHLVASGQMMYNALNGHEGKAGRAWLTWMLSPHSTLRRSSPRLKTRAASGIWAGTTWPTSCGISPRCSTLNAAITRSAAARSPGWVREARPRASTRCTYCAGSGGHRRSSWPARPRTSGTYGSRTRARIAGCAGTSGSSILRSTRSGSGSG
jgi:ubiquinone/menaquinone biosynthesis C-methylase UbiE